MPRWLHRTTKQELRSVPSAELPEPIGNYIEEPDLSAVSGFPTKYWIVTGDIVTLMDQAGRDAVDAAGLSVTFDALASELNSTTERDRAIVLALLDIVNFLSNQLESIKSAATSTGNHGAFSTQVAGIPSAPQRDIGELITLIRSKLGT